VNISDHYLRLPNPAIQCMTSDGYIQLSLIFRPLDPTQSGEGHGCAGDAYDRPQITERIKTWKVLHSGASLSMRSKRVDHKQPGTYEFWATYVSPSIKPSDQEILRQAGIDLPRGQSTTPHVVFEKKP
jgi:hypothetical protein